MTNYEEEESCLSKVITTILFTIFQPKHSP